MIDTPVVAAAFLGRDSGLALHQEQAARRIGVDLLAGEDVRVLGQEALEKGLRVVGLLVERLDGAIVLEQVDA